MATTVPTTAEPALFAPSAHYPALDGLRAIAFLMVFFYHYAALPWGFAGVDVFFVLSGFLITGILFDTCRLPHCARSFYIRRALRIFPLYYGVLLLIAMAWPWMKWQWNWQWLTWPLYLGNLTPYIHPFSSPNLLVLRLKGFELYPRVPTVFTPLLLGHFWTLCVEEQFYLVWPWVVFLLRDRRKLVWICAAALPLALAARVAGLHLLPEWMLANDVLFHATPFRVDDLLLGGLMALLLRGPSAVTLLRAARVATPLAFAALLAVAFATSTWRLWQQPYRYPPTRPTITLGLSIIGWLSALIILSAIQSDTLLARALSLSWLRWLGKISYGAYIFHVIPLHFYRYVGELLMPAHGKGVGCLLALAATLLLAWLSFRFYESPFLRLKDKLAPKTA
jgi:peptidoglycan/LPS O-acetylase OafA/YrhL